MTSYRIVTTPTGTDRRQPPLWLVLTGVGAALLLVGLVWVLLRRWPLVKGPLILAVAGDAITLMVVLLATLALGLACAPALSGYPGVVSGALALHGYPLAAMGIAISLVILLSTGLAPSTERGGRG